MSRKISAHYILPVSGAVIKYGIIVCSKEGEILDVIETGGIIRERASLEFYDGILVPGFVKDEGETDQSLFEALKKRMNENPDDRLENCIRNITLDRAVSNKTNSYYGSFEPKKIPGVYLISGIDFSGMRLKKESQLKILVPQGKLR